MKLYIVVRQDLDPGLQAAQACHAGREFTAQHPAIDRDWFETSKTLVLLGVPDEPALHALAREAAHVGAAVALNREPDLNDQATAVAVFGSEAPKLLSSLPLLLRARRRSTGTTTDRQASDAR